MGLKASIAASGPVGVLALQGDYAAHVAALRAAGAEAIEVRSARDLATVVAMVLPGGESTVMGSLLARFGFLEPLKDRIRNGMPVFGTCAGLILLAEELEDSDQPRLGLLCVKVRRNAYGTQVDSFRAPLKTAVPGAERLEGVFIRAPKIIKLGQGVEVLARQGGDPVLVRQGSILAASFHPELNLPSAIHEWFLGFPIEPRRLT
ncbi:MAG: pyridoxal 5'-phosphate synthase glutaminase subunit PdxT [Spirochaetes bacterium]|nr:pyridoxal 5'-phosphate synthase glutaminase subunit PdxT [Spirochaetota bacterium]